MSRRKLSIVVTCTDRKLAAPSEALMARTLPFGTVEERAAVWQSRLGVTPPYGRLIDLYKGESWTQSKRLAATARAVGYEPELFVASAGLGLRRAEECAPSYAATFARGQVDTVGATTQEAGAWWDLLPHTAAPAQHRPTIWVLSEAYALAMANLLEATDPETSLVFGGAPVTPGAVRIRSDRTLRAALGGTVTSLNTRMAIRWLELADQSPLTSPGVRRAWDAWAGSARQVEVYDRRPVSDSAIRALIDEMRKHQPKLTKTVALRNLRASGIACEQRRFSVLFEEG